MSTEFFNIANIQFRGHAVESTPEGWRYVDTGELYSEVGDRPCTYCQEMPTEEGYDPCLGKLPDGVTWACCGHGAYTGVIRWGNNPAFQADAVLE